MALFPVEAFERQLPPILLRHQLYSVLHDRTLVDRELVSLDCYSLSPFPPPSLLSSLPLFSSLSLSLSLPLLPPPSNFAIFNLSPCYIYTQLALRDKGKVRLFKLGVAEDEYSLVWNEDYENHVKTVLGSTQICKKFLEVVLPGNQEVSISRQQLKEEMKLSEEEITYVWGEGGGD